MKYIVYLLLLFLLDCATGIGQVRFSGCGEVKQDRFKDEILYVIQDAGNAKPFGKILFTPPEGGEGWSFSWTYNGVIQPVAPGKSSYLEVDIPGDGYYTFQAEKEGGPVQPVSRFHVFYDYVPEFSVALADVFDCSAISLAPVTDFRIPVYRYQGESFEGTGPVGYYLPGKSVPLRFGHYETAFQEKQSALSINADDREVTITITDKFGFDWTSKPVSYHSVVPSAKAELELINTVSLRGASRTETGQAPLEVRFHNHSVNAMRYEWLLYKDTLDMPLSSDLQDSLLDEQIRTQAEMSYTYEHSGRYKVHLIAINGEGNQCRDTTPAMYVNVIGSLVEVPNVFTPNGDGVNDVFQVKAWSVTEFHAVVLNRWGRKVFEWSDPDAGWDGRINGKYASPGTYYYIVTAKGSEKVNPIQYVKKGAFMLIR